MLTGERACHGTTLNSYERRGRQQRRCVAADAACWQTTNSGAWPAVGFAAARTHSKSPPSPSSHTHKHPPSGGGYGGGSCIMSALEGCLTSLVMPTTCHSDQSVTQQQQSHARPMATKMAKPDESSIAIAMGVVYLFRVSLFGLIEPPANGHNWNHHGVVYRRS